METFEQMGNKMGGILKDAATKFPFSNIGKTGEHTGKTGRLIGSPYEVGGVLYVDVRTTTAQGESINLTRVKVQQSKNGIIEPLPANKQVTIYIPSEEALVKQETSSMYIYPSADIPNYQNQALPASVINKIDPNSLKKSNNGVCISLRQAQNELELRKRQLYQRDGLVMIQHPNSISSPGIVIDPSGKGSMTQYNKNGDKQEFSDQGLQVNAKSFDTTTSTLNRSNLAYGGLPGTEFTQVRDLIPTSNIFTPTLSHIPAISKIMFLIGTVRMIINVAKIAKEGLQEVRRLQNEIRNLPEAPEEKTLKDSTELSKLKQKQKLMALAEALELAGDNNRASEIRSQLDAINKAEAQEAQLRQQKRDNRQKAFDSIVSDAAGSVQGIKDKYLKEGGSGDRDLDQIIPATPGAGYRGVNPQIPVRGAIDQTVVSNNGTNVDSLFDPNPSSKR